MLLVGAAAVLAVLSALAGIVAARGRFRGPWVVLAARDGGAGSRP